MARTLRKAVTALRLMGASPLMLGYAISADRDLIRADLKATASAWDGPFLARLAGALAFIPTFRTAYYYRLAHGSASTGALAGALRLVYRAPSTLILESEDIGPGMCFVHGFATIVWTRSIGARCRIYQNVTVGIKPPGQLTPIIGDDVTIYTGAVVIGDVRIGDGATIAANAVVTRDVPRGALAAGVPARIITR